MVPFDVSMVASGRLTALRLGPTGGSWAKAGAIKPKTMLATKVARLEKENMPSF
jgi:hypothetical protein